MAEGIVTIVASILSLVAGYFLKDWVQGLLQIYANWQNERAIKAGKKDVEDLKSEAEKLLELEKKWRDEQNPPTLQGPKD